MSKTEKRVREDLHLPVGEFRIFRRLRNRLIVFGCFSLWDMHCRSQNQSRFMQGSGKCWKMTWLMEFIRNESPGPILANRQPCSNSPFRSFTAPLIPSPARIFPLPFLPLLQQSGPYNTSLVSGDCCMLLQWGPGRRPGRSRILLHCVIAKCINICVCGFAP